MERRGLTLDIIVDTATKLVEEKGYNDFSLRELALRLNVKAASLYYHVSGVDDITRAVGKLASGRMNHALEDSIHGKVRDDAVCAIAHAYRNYVQKNPELYQAIIDLPLSGDKNLADEGRQSISPIYHVMMQYDISADTALHCQRIFRSALHGFTMLEAAGFFQTKGADLNVSFDLLVKEQILLLHSLEGNTSI